MAEKRAVCLNCMDGRVQLPVIKWIKDEYEFDFVDMLTEPGMDGLLSDEKFILAPLLKKMLISIQVNSAKKIFVAGHYDCRGNPVSDAEHKRQIIAGVQRLRIDFPQTEVIGLWVNSMWEVEKLG